MLIYAQFLWLKVKTESVNTFKTKDICYALSIRKHHLRVWTDTLEPYCSQPTTERYARRYDLGDLLFFALVRHLEVRFGISIQSIRQFSSSLYTVLRAPKSFEELDKIFIDFGTYKCTVIGKLVTYQTEPGIVVSTQEAKQNLCNYFGLIPSQTTSQLGLALVG